MTNKVLLCWHKIICLKVFLMKIAYPIMAREHEMIMAEASIPERIFIGNNLYVVSDRKTNGMNIMGSTNVKMFDHHNHTEGKEIHRSSIWISGTRKSLPFKFMYESSFCGVYMLLRGPSWNNGGSPSLDTCILNFFSISR